MQSPAEGLARRQQADAVGRRMPATPAIRPRRASAPQHKGPQHEGRCRAHDSLISPVSSTAMPATPAAPAGSPVAPTRGARLAS